MTNLSSLSAVSAVAPVASLADHKATLRSAFVNHFFPTMTNIQSRAVQVAWDCLDALPEGVTKSREDFESMIARTLSIKPSAAKVGLDLGLRSSPDVYATPGRSGGIKRGDVRIFQATRGQSKAPTTGGESCCSLCGYSLGAERAEQVRRFLASLDEAATVKASLPAALPVLSKEESEAFKRTYSKRAAETGESAPATEGPSGPTEADSAPVPTSEPASVEALAPSPEPAVMASEDTSAADAIASARTARKGKRAPKLGSNVGALVDHC